MRAPATGRAAGKVILLGEHAVVYGRSALAAGLPLGLVVEVTAGAGPAAMTDRPELADDPRPLKLLVEGAQLFGLDPRELVVRVTSELPAGVGLGSSAALAVAMLRALATVAGRAMDRMEEIESGRRLEAIFHGHPSGVDPAAAVLGAEGGCFRFVRGTPPLIAAVRPAMPLAFVVAIGDRPRRTAAAVGGLRERWRANPEHHERVFDEVAAVVEAGIRAVETGDAPALGRAFDANQRLLQALGVSSPEVEALVAAARRAGALGAKLTGGGTGGAVIALAPEAPRVAARLGATGVRTLVAIVGGGAEEAA